MMPRIYKYCFIFFFSSLSIFSHLAIFTKCYAQSITWQRTYDGPAHYHDGGYDICQADGENFYAVGYVSVSEGGINERIHVQKCNRYGDTLWTRNPSYGRCFSIVSDNNGGCVFIADSLVHLNSQGTLVWKKPYNCCNIQCEKIIRTADGYYIACGSANFTNACVIKFDSTGNLIWQKIYTSTAYKGFLGITESVDRKKYLLSGYTNLTQTDTTRGTITELDTQGTVIWERVFRIEGNTTCDRILRTTNGYLIAGKTALPYPGIFKSYFIRTDTAGNLYYTKLFETTVGELFGDLIKIDENKYVISMGHDSGIITKLKLKITDSTGNELNSRIYPTGNYIETYSTMKVSNGDLIFVGDARYTFSENADIYILRTDSLLNAPPPIGIIQTETENPRVSFLYQNYPNPFNPNTAISFDLPVSGHTTLFLYDITGKIVKELVDAYKPAGNYTVKFDGSNLASGVYFYRLLSGNYSQTKKMVLIK